LVYFATKECIPLSDFYKIRHERKSRVHTLTPNFTVVVFKMWAYRPQNWYKFGINFPQRVYLLKRFLQKLAWGVPRLHPQANFTVLLLKMWTYSPQSLYHFYTPNFFWIRIRSIVSPLRAIENL